MSKQVPFIGRSDELTHIQTLIAEQNRSRKVVCIHGAGGIGKTRLLQEVISQNTAADTPDDSNPPNNKEITIAVLNEFMDTEWSQLFSQGANAMSKDLDVHLIQIDARFSVDQMVSDLESVIETKPDALIIRLGTNDKLRPGIQKAVDKRIPVITLDNYLSGLPKEVYNVALDDSSNASEIYEKMITDIQGEGKIAVIWTPTSNMQEWRKSNLSNALRLRRGISIVEQFGAHGKYADSEIYQKTREAIRTHPDLKAFIVMWDGFSETVMQAIEDEERKDIYIYSFDAYHLGLIHHLREPGSVLKAVVCTNPEVIGQTIVRLATSLACGEIIENQYLIPSVLMTAENPASLQNEETLPATEWPGSETGWTNSLRFRQNITSQQPQKCIAIKILDFDDRTLHLPQNLQRRIAYLLDEREFVPYLREMQDWSRIELSGVSQQKLATKYQEINIAFAECFNRMSSRRRIIVALDTTDAIKKTQEWKSILEFILPLKNCVILIAGRNAKMIYNLMQEYLNPDDLLLQELKPFSDNDSRNYLKQKMNLRQVIVEPELEERLLFLAAGKPILIDLALEWRAHHASFDWLMEKDLEMLHSTSAEQLKGYRQKFESMLVDDIKKTLRNLDWLNLAMSYVYPVDIGMVATLLEFPINEAEKLFDEAKEYVYVKQWPDGRIALHDEMRSMIEEHVWPTLDSDKHWMRHFSELAAKYLEQQTNRMFIDLSEQRKQAEELLQQNLDELERNYWELQLEQTRYGLRADINHGIDVFAMVFDIVPRHTILDVRGRLLALIQNELGEISAEEPSIKRDPMYKYQLRRAIYKIEMLQLDEARQILENLQEEYPELDHQIDLQTRFSRIAERSGKLPQALAYLQQARDLCEANPQIRETSGGAIYNSLGRINRMLGNWKQARDDYFISIELTQATTDEKRLASAYNNLGYVIGLLKSYDGAVLYCNDALEIQERNGWKYSSGRTLNTLGIIYRGKREFHMALEYTNQALAIFQQANDQEWIAQAYCEMGITFWHMGNLYKAEEVLNQSYQINEKIGLRSAQVNVLHALGHVAWAQERMDNAERYFRESAELAEEFFDPRQAVNSLQGLVELYYDLGYKYHQQEDLVNRDKWYQKSKEAAEDWKKRYEDQGYDFQLYSGDRMRTLGNIAFDCSEYESALQYYLAAYPKTASPWGYSKNLLPEALKKLQARIDQLPPDLALEWCDQIEKEWIRLDKAREAPEMLDTCQICRNHAKRRAAAKEKKENG